MNSWLPERMSQVVAEFPQDVAEPVKSVKTPCSGPTAATSTRSPEPWSHVNGIQSPRVNVVDCGRDDLHVLLRHRPRSIPQAQESA